MTDTRTCEQCGTRFVPRREHARFCSPSCRVTWNRRHASDPPAENGPLAWSVTAMRETTDRLFLAGSTEATDGFAVISEAVWWVTIVDATMIRYHPAVYAAVLAGQAEAEGRVTEDTFGGLRFVRNRMGYDADPADFIKPGLRTSRLAAWTWRPVPEPALASLPPRGREWEMTRYRSYQAELAGRAIGESFTRASAFLQLAADSSSLSPA